MTVEQRLLAMRLSKLVRENPQIAQELGISVIESIKEKGEKPQRRERSKR